MGGEFLEKFVIIHPPSHLSLLLGLLAKIQSVVWVLFSLISDTIPMWDHFRVARSIGPTAFGFLPLAMFKVSHVPGVRESLVVLQDDHAPVTGAKLYFFGLMGVSLPHSLFPCGGGGVCRHP